ncbi:MAG: GNAT family N-acetyltransferase [Opitutaceae bacterium]|nr:GNAT family N-acetyltransferase [Opitutaceae bacterium]
MQGLEITSGGLELLSLVRPLREKLYAHHAALMPCFEHEFDVQKISEYDRLLADKKRTKSLQVFAAKTEEGRLAGYSLVKVDVENKGELDSLFVEEVFRGEGLARELSLRAVEWLKQQAVVSLSVRVLPDNQAAKALYRDLGFMPRSLMMRICDQ